MSKKFIFTDIDGVLNPDFTRKWNKSCIEIYNKICHDFDLLPVITSTWRIKYNIPQLQNIFIEQGITAKIYDYTPILYDSRDVEIYEWLKENEYSKYVVIDDKYIEILYVVKVGSD